MYDGRLLPRLLRRDDLRNWWLLGLLALMVAGWLALQPIWQPPSVTTGNCQCGWPGCGCVELTLQPYTMPTSGFIPWATIAVPNLPGDPGPAATATWVATSAAQPTTPPNSQPTAVPQPTQPPVPTAPPYPTSVPTVGAAPTVAPP